MRMELSLVQTAAAAVILGRYVMAPAIATILSRFFLIDRFLTFGGIKLIRTTPTVEVWTPRSRHYWLNILVSAITHRRWTFS